MSGGPIAGEKLTLTRGWVFHPLRGDFTGDQGREDEVEEMIRWEIESFANV